MSVLFAIRSTRETGPPRRYFGRRSFEQVGFFGERFSAQLVFEGIDNGKTNHYRKCGDDHRGGGSDRDSLCCAGSCTKQVNAIVADCQ